VQNFAFKFQAVAEKTANIVRGLLYFAAPCTAKAETKHATKYVTEANSLRCIVLWKKKQRKLKLLSCS